MEEAKLSSDLVVGLKNGSIVRGIDCAGSCTVSVSTSHVVAGDGDRHGPISEDRTVSICTREMSKELKT